MKWHEENVESNECWSDQASINSAHLKNCHTGRGRGCFLDHQESKQFRSPSVQEEHCVKQEVTTSAAVLVSLTAIKDSPIRD